jgi:hypothetical protein
MKIGREGGSVSWLLSISYYTCTWFWVVGGWGRREVKKDVVVVMIVSQD